MQAKGDYKIDAVITWVDGEDPVHQAKRERYLTKKRENRQKDVAGATRFNQVGEIYYCLASIMRFAPWINRIFIVTDNQNPNADEFLDRYFPERTIPIEIVDHKEIFKGYEDVLPTFNSLTITSMLWRIPSLSEHFILFNDDVILQKPVTPDDFYHDNKIVLYGQEWLSVPVAKMMMTLQTIGRHIVGRKQLMSFKRFMCNAAITAGSRRFIRLRHTPHAFFKSIFSDFFAAHPQDLQRNIEHRFRNRRQYSAAELHHLLAYKQKRVVTPLKKDCDAFISPYEYDLEGLRRELNRIESNENYIYFCVNSLDRSSKENIDEVISWMHRIIGLH